MENRAIIFFKFLFVTLSSYATLFLVDKLFLSGTIIGFTIVLPGFVIVLIWAIFILSYLGIYYVQNLSSPNNYSLITLPLVNFLLISSAWLTFSLYRYVGAFAIFGFITIFGFFKYQYYFLLTTSVFASIVLSLVTYYLKRKSELVYKNTHWLIIFFSLLIIPLSFSGSFVLTEKSRERSLNKLSESVEIIKLSPKNLAEPTKPWWYPGGYRLGFLEANSPDANFNLKIKKDNPDPKKIFFILTDLKSNQGREIYFDGPHLHPRPKNEYAPEAFEWIDNQRILIYQGIRVLSVWRFNIRNFQKERILTTENACIHDYYRFFPELNQFRYIAENGDVTSIDINTLAEQKLYHFPNFNPCRKGIVWSNTGRYLISGVDIIDLETKSIIKSLDPSLALSLYDAPSSRLWSPNDAKINTLDINNRVYDLNNTELDLGPLYERLGFRFVSWYDESSFIASSNIGKILINLNDLSYKKIELLQ